MASAIFQSGLSGLSSLTEMKVFPGRRVAFLAASLGWECYMLSTTEELECLAPVFWSRAFPLANTIVNMDPFSFLFVPFFNWGTSAYALKHERTKENQNFHRICSGLDHIANMIVKVANTVAVFQFFKQKINLPAGIAAGAAIGALSAYNAKCAWDRLTTMRGDEVQ
jgi:hypothetical protein